MKRLHTRFILVYACAAFAAFGASGCATAPGRMNDLKDIGKFSVGYGYGLDVTAKVGGAFQPSLGIGSITTRAGLESRQMNGVWKESQGVWPAVIVRHAFCNFSFIVPCEHKHDAVLLASTWRSCHQVSPYSSRFDEYSTVVSWWLPVPNNPTWTPGPFSFHELTDLEIGATLGVVSVRVGINPLEILDFLLGFAGFDIAGDDNEYAHRKR